MNNSTRLKAHINFRLCGQNVLLTWDGGGRVLLKGSTFVEIVPLLQGDYSVDEIVEAVAGRVPATHAYYALSKLQERGLITASHGNPTAGAAFWEHCGTDTATVHSRLSSLAITVVSTITEDPHVALIAEALETLGFSLSERHDADCVVVHVRDYLDLQARTQIHNFLLAGKRCFPLKSRGVESWWGPLLGEGASCWSCLCRRLQENQPDKTRSSEIIESRFAQTDFLETTVSIAVNFSVTSLAQQFIGTSSQILDNLVSVDHRSGMVRTHEVRRLPDCDSCGIDHAPAADLPLELVITSRKKKFISDGGHRVCTPEETYRRLEPLTSSVTGVVPDLEQVELSSGLHVFQTKQNTPLAAHTFYSADLARRDGAAGKGLSEMQARVSCLAEAIERYSCIYRGTETRRSASFVEISDSAISPDQLLQFSRRQYGSRDIWNRIHPGFNWVPEPFLPTLPIEWSPAWSLTRKTVRWLPTAFCYFGYKFSDKPHFCRSDSNGCASGNTVEEAILQGFFELVERDAMAIFWYNRVRRPRICIEDQLDPTVRNFTKLYRSLGRHLELIDITNDLGITTVLAVSWNRNGRQIIMGLGAHLDSRIAIGRALTELNQMLPVVSALNQTEPHKGSNPVDDEHISEWLNVATIDNQPYLVPSDEGTRTLSDLITVFNEDLADDIEWCVARLERMSLEMIVLDMTRADVQFPTVRVVVPSLRHFWARLGEGRLYDVPVHLGWLPKQRTELELNPIPLFL